jgi:ABC transporter substrate binding protein
MEGRDVHLEYRWPKGGPEGLPALAAQLVQSRFDMILAVSSGAARAAKRATSTVPIVFCAVGEDPVQNGMVSSVARPGGNATGTVTRSSRRNDSSCSTKPFSASRGPLCCGTRRVCPIGSRCRTSRRRRAVSVSVSSSAARETGTYARRELRDREGLGQVVGCSEIEAGTSIDLVIQCRQHEDWQRRRR